MELLLIAYFIPLVVAILRRHKATGAILAANIFFGWTIIGWILILIWALNSNTQGRVSTDPVQATPNKVSFKRVPAHVRLRDNSTREHYWAHPPGHPYQVYGDDIPDPDHPTIWTNTPDLPGHRLVMDNHSDRLYHIPEKEA